MYSYFTEMQVSLLQSESVRIIMQILNKILIGVLLLESTFKINGKNVSKRRKKDTKSNVFEWRMRALRYLFV